MAETSDLLADPATRGDIPLRDGEGAINPAFTQAVAGAVEAADAVAATRLAGDLHEADAGALLEALDPELRPRLIELLGANFDFAALTQVDDAIREEILDDLPTETVAEGVRELESDDAVTILEDLDEKEQGEVLRSLPTGERVALQTSLDYPEASAGRLMRTELVTAPPDWTVGRMIDFLRESDDADLPDSFFEVFVTAPDRKLLGNVFLDRLTRSQRPVRLDAIMDPDRRSVRDSLSRKTFPSSFLSGAVTKTSKNESGRSASSLSRRKSIVRPTVQNGGAVTSSVRISRPAEASG